jgi:N-acetyl-S-(2-succino)cysteine monooxygenase
MVDNQSGMKLGMFFFPCGHHLAAWRHPDAVPDSGENMAHLIEVAQLAERGLFDLFFMADGVTFFRGSLDSMMRDSYSARIEPFSLMVALAQHTTHLGLVCTATTTFDQPYSLARRFASLDVASDGRAGWNLVTSSNRFESDSFGVDDLAPKGERYRRAHEFAHVVRGLWNSFDDGAFLRDRDTGVFLDRDKLHILDHHGEFFRVRGPLNVPPSPQGEPVLVQAGQSDEGRELAAETAEVIFGIQQDLAGAKNFYADVKGRMSAYDRPPEALKIMPGLMVFTGRTREEAQVKYDEMQDLIDPITGVELLSHRLDFDLSGYDVDGPLPEIANDGISASRVQWFLDIARRDKMSIRQLWQYVAGARGHLTIVGSAVEVADFMEEWFTQKACDGFNIMPPLFPNSLADFVDLVVPELQHRGLFRTEYAGTTLRANLGLDRPRWPSGRLAEDVAAE